MEFLSAAGALVIMLFVPSLGFDCPKAMFWFGDSIVDTGNVQAAAPFISAAEYKPYGMTFFGKPSRRYSDGRLIVDFFAEAFKYDGFLDPILQSINSNYANGVNFAVSGATALNTSFEVPLYLPVQIDQFARFKQDAYGSIHHKQGKGMRKLVPDYRHLKTALYAVVISSNDLLDSYLLEQRSPENVTTEVVPQVVRAISQALQSLHEHGAQNLLVFSTFPHGCMPLLLSIFGQYMPKDSRGCLLPFNQVAEAFNKQLYDEIQILQKNRTGFQPFYADAYKFALDVLDKPRSYGFENETKLSACCGSGGEYNFDVTQPCGLVIQPNATSLKPSEYISWDGVHFTESFYRQYSKALLTGRYIYPSLNITQICKLDLNQI